jgi:hypothetical protein
MADLDEAVKRIEQGEAWDETDEVVKVEVKKPLDRVIPIRLSSDKWEELRTEARGLGVGPTTLARMWILERLRVSQLKEATLSNILETNIQCLRELSSKYPSIPSCPQTLHLGIPESQLEIKERK